jgi:hypothetical protein
MSKTVEGRPSRRLVISTVIRDHEVPHGLYRPLQESISGGSIQVAANGFIRPFRSNSVSNCNCTVLKLSASASQALHADCVKLSKIWQKTSSG